MKSHTDNQQSQYRSYQISLKELYPQQIIIWTWFIKQNSQRQDELKIY